MRTYKEFKMAKTRTRYEFNGRNQNKEKITVEIIECVSCKQQLKLGYPSHWLAVDIYAVKENGECSGRYELFTISENFIDENGRKCCYKRLDVKNLLTVSDENKKKILEMVEKLAFS